MNKKKVALLLMTFWMILHAVIPTQAATRSTEVNKVKNPPTSYRATFFIGEMAFDGTLSRMDVINDEDKKKAVQEALKELGKTQLEIREAQQLVEKVIRDEELTPEEIKETWDNILKIAGVDNIADAVRVLLGESDQSASEVAANWGVDQAKEELLETILVKSMEDVAEGAGGVASKVLDAVVISADQYQKDQEKWKNRADAANAKRLLQKYDELVNEKSLRYMTGIGWGLNINQKNYRIFPFFGIDGNTENWTVNIHLEKLDSDPKTGPNGIYTGNILIKAEYEMDPFDNGFEKLYREKASAAIQGLTGAGGLAFSCSDSHQPTQISRTLYAPNNMQVSLPITLPNGHGQYTVPVDLSGLRDEILMNISHVISNTVNDEDMSYSWEVKYESLDNEPPQSIGGAQTMFGAWGVPMEWDSTIWQQWEKEKSLVVYLP